MAEQEKSKEGHDEKSLLSMKNTKKDVMKVVEEKERITNLLKEAKNFPGDKEAQVKVSEWIISMSSTEDFVTDLYAAEALVKMVSESGDTPVISKILSKQNYSEAIFLDCLRKEKIGLQESLCTPLRRNSSLKDGLVSC